jgi:hypothetical protein
MAMTTREKLHAEIDTLDEKSVDAVYQMVQRYAQPQPGQRSGDLLTMLQQVKIDGPEDFSENLDLYLYGEKHFPDDIR